MQQDRSFDHCSGAMRGVRGWGWTEDAYRGNSLLHVGNHRNARPGGPATDAHRPTGNRRHDATSRGRPRAAPARAPPPARTARAGRPGAG
jgi:hypothetical protein